MKLFLVLVVVPVAAVIVPGGGGGGNHENKRGVRIPRPQQQEILRECDVGWQRFARPSGPWCIRVVNSTVDYAGADEQCRAFGGLLSGLQNFVEITYVTGEVLRHQTSGSVWVGATRVVACMGLPLGGLCTPQTAFQWTDASTTGTAGFNWDVRMPDNNGTRNENCALLLASTSPTVRQAGLTWQTSHLDDTICAGTVEGLANTPRRVYGFVCGKRPTLRV